MKNKVFHLPEDSAGDVMEEVGRLGRKVTGEERLRGEMVLEETYLRLAKGMGNPKLPMPMALSSSNAALPQTLQLVTRQLGVAPSLASFAVPVGIQLHQGGTCAFLAFPAMIMARVFGKPFTMDFLLCLLLYVFIFAYTMPPVPGTGLICLGYLFAAIGVPPETVMLFFGVAPICDMLNTAPNVVCNVSSSLLLARKYDMWDEKLYRKE